MRSLYPRELCLHKKECLYILFPCRVLTLWNRLLFSRTEPFFHHSFLFELWKIRVAKVSWLPKTVLYFALLASLVSWWEGFPHSPLPSHFCWKRNNHHQQKIQNFCYRTTPTLCPIASLRRNLHHMVDKKLEFDIQIKQPSTELKQIRYHERFHLFSTSWRSTVVYSSIFWGTLFSNRFSHE